METLFHDAPADRASRLGILIYLAIGLAVAWLHIRQQKMSQSVESLGRHQATGLIYMLSCMWPLLLFAMALNYLQPAPRTKRKPKDDEPSKREPTSDERE